jgi:hypothetical protein
MASLKSPPDQVNAFIHELDDHLAELVQAVRETILNVSKDIGEQIKWNSPSFYYTGEMKAFDPKTYKRDLVVVNIRKGSALLVFPTGATIPDTTGIWEGNYTDGRRLVNIRDMEDLGSKKKTLSLVIQQWLDLIEK